MATKLIQKIDWMLVEKALRNANELPTLPDNPRIAYSHYDDGADVLYIHFVSHFDPADSEMFEGDVLVDYDEKDRVIGLTVLDFQARLEESIYETSLKTT